MGTLEMLNVREWGARWCLLVMLCWVLCFTGCENWMEPGFEGTFVHLASSEFSEANDTLRVEKIGEEGYVVHRSTGIRLVGENGALGRLVLEREVWKVALDGERMVLVERSKGRELSLSEGNLMLERAVYRRLP